MRELHYGTGVITVSFDVCSAVFDYAVALANHGKTDRVTVPILVDGERAFSNLLLGPATQLFCTPTSSSGDLTDLDDIALVDELRAKTSRLSTDQQPSIQTSGDLRIPTLELDD